MLSSYYFRQRIPQELRAEIDRANAERAAIIHRALSRLTDGAIVVTEGTIRTASRLLAALRRHREEIAAYRELSRLSDRSLKDIGIERGQIRQAVRGLAQDETRNARGGADNAPQLRVIRNPRPALVTLPADLRQCA